jgi:putative membrane protein
MKLFATIMIVLVALEHIFILWVEMFAWTTKGKAIFNALPDDMYDRTKVMAANQGLYNGFLAAGLIWSLCIEDAMWSKNIALFFLACVVVAGLYGGTTVSKAIILKQALPAAIALLAVILWF